MNRFSRFLFALEKEENVFVAALKELFEAIKRDYFTIDYGEYEHLGIDPYNSSGISVEIIIVFSVIGMIFACFAASFNKGTLGAFVRTLVRNECFSKESAKTLGELGFLKKSAVRSSLKRGYLKRFVRCVEDDEGTLKSSDNREGKVEFNDAHFYIPEEDKYKIEVRFEGKKTPPVMYFVMIIAGIVLSVVLIKVLPNILAMLNDLVGAATGEGNILT